MKPFLWFGGFVFGKFLDGINKMKKVSVIIISYNVRSYLAHAIDSILKSNYENLEIIVVDNHSYDGTCDYLKENYQILNCSLNQQKSSLGLYSRETTKYYAIEGAYS